MNIKPMSPSIRETINTISAMAKAGKTAEQIALQLQGQVVKGGVYPIGIKIGHTIYDVAALQPGSASVQQKALAA